MQPIGPIITASGDVLKMMEAATHPGYSVSQVRISEALDLSRVLDGLCTVDERLDDCHVVLYDTEAFSEDPRVGISRTYLSDGLNNCSRDFAVAHDLARESECCLLLRETH